MRAKACKPTAALTSCPQTNIKDRPACLGDICVQHVEIPTVSGFLDRNYRYKSVPLEIPRDIGLARIPYTGQKTVSHPGLNQRLIL